MPPACSSSTVNTGNCRRPTRWSHPPVETAAGASSICAAASSPKTDPCIDACVDYRAIPPCPTRNGFGEKALARLHAQLGDPYSHATRAERRRKCAPPRSHRCRPTSATCGSSSPAVSGRSLDDINAVRESITRRVDMLRQNALNHSLTAAARNRRSTATPPGGWKRWLRGKWLRTARS